VPGHPWILVVDDDEAIRNVIADLLREQGYEVTTAENGAVALLQMGDGHHPDLVLLDLMMPVMSGWEVLEQMQATAELAGIPVVVLSAMAAPGTGEHLGKPVDLERLLATVERVAR
jgi:CheY-like chemotaxis protein